MVLSASQLTTPPGTGITVCSYDLASESSVNGFLRATAWDVVINDEEHFLKSPDAVRTRAVFGRHGIARNAERVWNLTGTPAPNNASELWVILSAAGIVKQSYESFVFEFCEWHYDARGQLRITGTLPEKIPQLRTLLAPILLRRRKSEVMPELPPIFVTETQVPSGEIDYELAYPEFFMPNAGGADGVRKVVQEEEATLQRAYALATSAKTDLLAALQSSTSKYRRHVGLAKIDAVAEMVAGELEVGAYEKVVIFAQHRIVIETLREKLRKYHPVTLYGGTPPMKRERNIERFQKDPKYQVYIGNIIASGTNVTLTAAHNIVVVEPDWVPGNNAQAIMRCHRIGQDKPVYVRFVSLADNDLDRKIQRVNRRKTTELTQLFDV